MKLSRVITLMAGCVALSCAPHAEPINYGEDQCAYCKMTIEDPKYGAEIVTAKGRVYKFDAIECLIANLPKNDEASIILVTPYDRVGTLTSVDSVSFLKSEDIKSPMGAGLAAFHDIKNAEEFLKNGQRMKWDEVKTKILPK